MKWTKVSEKRPEHKQLCNVKTMVQLDLFLDSEICIENSIIACVYNQTYDAFYEIGTNRKVNNPKYWQPLNN